MMIAMLLSVAGAFGQDKLSILNNGSIEVDGSNVYMRYDGNGYLLDFGMNKVNNKGIIIMYTEDLHEVTRSTFKVIDISQFHDKSSGSLISVFHTNTAKDIQVIITNDDYIVISLIDN